MRRSSDSTEERSIPFRTMWGRLGVIASCCVLAMAFDATGQEWPQWRGPSYDGSQQAKDLPVTFGRDENVHWKRSLPGPGASTPIVIGGRVFLTAVDLEKKTRVALALDASTGGLLWSHSLGGEEGSAIALYRRSNFASPSAVADGERVIFFFGDGDLIALDVEGVPLWSRNLQEDFGEFAFQWTFSATPTLWNGGLYLPVLQRDEPANGHGVDGAESFLLALDPVTGETRYRHVRKSDAVKESLESYATAIPYVGEGGREELLVVGGDVITGHDPRSGEELWRWGTWNPGHREAWWRVVPSPVTGAGKVLVCAPKRAPVFAIELGGAGLLGDDALAWKSEGRPNPVSSDVPTPLFYDGNFFVLSDLHSALSKVDPESGDVAWTLKLPGRSLWRGSPTGGDGKVYCLNHSGEVAVVDATSGVLLAMNEMAGPDDDLIRSSIAIAYDRLFIRTNDTLYCVALETDV